MSVLAQQVLQIALVAIALRKMPFNRHPLAPWQDVGSGAIVTIVNPTDVGPMPVTVTAPEVDDAVRSLGVIGARDSLIARLPYADARVVIHIDALDVPLNVNRPLFARITLKEKQ